MSSLEEQPLFKEQSFPIGRMQSRLEASFVTPSPKIIDGDSNQFVYDEPFIDKRKLSSTMVAKDYLNNGEHTLIPVMVKMIHSAVWECNRLILKDSQPRCMVKFVGAVRNFRVYTKYVHIDVEDGTGLVQVHFFRKEKECSAQHWLIHECNGNCNICVIREVGSYYGVNTIIALDVLPVSSGNKVAHHFWR
jgi:hypothetical protein